MRYGKVVNKEAAAELEIWEKAVEVVETADEFTEEPAKFQRQIAVHAGYLGGLCFALAKLRGTDIETEINRVTGKVDS